MSSNYTPWERVQISRSAERPTSLDYISTIFERYMSLHGDRYFGDDKAIVGGLASIGDSHRTAKRTLNQRKYQTKFWNAITRRIQKIPKTDETGREISSSDHSLCRHTRSILWIRGRRRRSRRGNRKKLIRDVKHQSTDSFYHDRRRRKWWSLGYGCWK